MSPGSRFRWLSKRLPSAAKRRIVVLTGARQTGKTTLARATWPDLRYFDMEDPDVRTQLRDAPASAWRERVGPAVLDEAQKEPDVFAKVKVAYDARAIDFTALLGSSHVLLLRRVHETLAGRAFLCELWPLMASELRNAGETPPSATPLIDDLLRARTNVADALAAQKERLFPDENSPRRLAVEHLDRWGGMPEILRLDESERADWLGSYQRTYLERDLADAGDVRDLVQFRTFQRLVMLRTGQILSYADLARDAQTTPATARRWLSHLVASYQLLLVQPFRRNLTSSVVKSPKLYWTDLGLLRQGTQQWGPATGAMFETLVVGEIHKWIATMGVDARLTYYRTRSGLEVDLLITTPDGVLGVEVKHRMDAVPSDATGMRSVAEALGKEWLGGVVVYRGDDVRPLIKEREIWAVPAHRLF